MGGSHPHQGGEKLRLRNWEGTKEDQQQPGKVKLTTETINLMSFGKQTLTATISDGPHEPFVSLHS